MIGFKRILNKKNTRDPKTLDKVDLARELEEERENVGLRVVEYPMTSIEVWITSNALPILFFFAIREVFSGRWPSPTVNDPRGLLDGERNEEKLGEQGANK